MKSSIKSFAMAVLAVVVGQIVTTKLAARLNKTV